MGKRINREANNHLLPEVIVDEILTYLPVKSLLRFKCVSKRWRTLISSKSFIQEHLNKSSQFTRQQLIYTSFKARTPDFRGFDHTRQRLRSCPLKSFLDDQNSDCSMITTLDHHPGNSVLLVPEISRMDPTTVHIRVLGSCDGLVLITFNLTDLFLWNLSTRKFRSIRTASLPKPESVFPRYQYGLGYDDSTDYYKVVCISFHSKPCQTKIYSLKTDSWKEIENYDEGSQSGIGGADKFVNGKIYWALWDWKADKCDRCSIVSLSLVEEKFEVVARPPHVWDYDFDGQFLQVLGGYLSFSGMSSTMDIHVWIMKNEYGDAESWTKIWTLSDFADPRRYNGPSPRPMWLNKNGDLAMSFGKSTVVVVYNGKNKLHESLVDVTISRYNIYVESLVSIFGDEELPQ